MRTLIVAMLVVLGAAVVGAEDVNAPKIKDEVALSIRSLQVQVLVLQENDAVKNYLGLTQQLKAKYDSALKDSGIDGAKYQLNPMSLMVEAVPTKEK